MEVFKIHMYHEVLQSIDLTGKVGVIQNICDMVSYENQKFWGIFFHTHMGAS